MNMLTSQEEKDLVGAIEQSIRLTHDGMAPNDAISKVARERKYSPPKISRMVEAFNKSKSVHVFNKSANEDRAKPFAIADTETIVASIYEPPQKEASAEFGLPQGDKLTVDFTPAPAIVLEKVAKLMGPPDFSDDPTFDRLLKQAEREQGDIRCKIQDDLHITTQFYKMAFENALESICEHVAPLSPGGLRKVGQFIFNGYPETGNNLLSLVAHKARVEFPEFTKTASAVVFPTREPYLTVSKLYEAADNLAAAEIKLQVFKEGAGEGFTSNLAANALANWMAGSGADPKKLGEVMGSKKKPPKHVTEDLDPEFFNRMKSQDAKRTFMQLALYDPELKEYDFQELRRAYNQAVSTVPEAYADEARLKDLMVKNLQSSGVRDAFEMEQELKLSESLRKRQADIEDRERESVERLEEKKRVATEMPPPSPVSLGVRPVLEAGAKGLGDVAKIYSKSRGEAVK